jgi:hypothetical protein
MSRPKKTLARILSGVADTNVSFAELTAVLRALGFAERVKGDHFIYSREGVVEIINIQPKGSKAKPYQVKQVRDIIVAYKLAEAL